MARKLKAGAIPPVPTEVDPKPEQQAPGGEAPPAEMVEALYKAEADLEAMQKPKRRGRPRAAPPPSVVSDETIREHCLKCSRFFSELQTAREGVSVAMGTYRAALKEAKKAGVSTQAISWYQATRNRDPEEVDRETRERNRLARVMGLPIGTQLGLFDDGGTVAGAVDQAKIAAEQAGEKQPGDAFNEGLLAGKDGKALSTNPFEEGTPSFDDFERGWGEGTSSNVLGGVSLGNGAGATAH